MSETEQNAPCRSAAPDTAACGRCVADVPSAAKLGRQAGGRAATLPVCLAILLLALLWWFDPAKTNLPACTFHALTGLDCPGCGATRATHELLHGRLLTALRYNPLWVLSLPLVLYLAVSEWRLSAGRRPLPGDLPRQPWFWISLVTLATAYVIVRNLPWAYLCPNLHFW